MIWEDFEGRHHGMMAELTRVCLKVLKKVCVAPKKRDFGAMQLINTKMPMPVKKVPIVESSEQEEGEDGENLKKK